MGRNGRGGKRRIAKAAKAPPAPPKEKSKELDTEVESAAPQQGTSRPSDKDTCPITLNATSFGVLAVVKVLEETLPYCTEEVLRMRIINSVEKTLFQLVKAEIAYFEAAAIINKVTDTVAGDLHMNDLLVACDTLETLSLDRIRRYKEDVPDDIVKAHPTYVKVKNKMMMMLEESRKQPLEERYEFRTRGMRDTDVEQYFKVLRPWLPPGFDFDIEVGRLRTLPLASPDSAESDPELEPGQLQQRGAMSNWSKQVNSIRSHNRCVKELLIEMQARSAEHLEQRQGMEERRGENARPLRELHQMQEQEEIEEQARANGAHGVFRFEEEGSEISVDVEHVDSDISVDEPRVTMTKQVGHVVQEEEYLSDGSSERSRSVTVDDFGSEVIVVGQELGDIDLNCDTTDAAPETIPEVRPITLSQLQNALRNRNYCQIDGRATTSQADGRNLRTNCPIDLCTNASFVNISDLIQINDPELAANVAPTATENPVDTQPEPALKSPAPMAKMAGRRRRR